MGLSRGVGVFDLGQRAPWTGSAEIGAFREEEELVAIRLTLPLARRVQPLAPHLVAVAVAQEGAIFERNGLAHPTSLSTVLLHQPA